MKKVIELAKQGFESSSQLTPEFSTFFKLFKKEFTKALKGIECTKIKISRGHFYINGFFTNHTGQTYYFSFSDARDCSFDHIPNLMYRTAKDYKDYRGGANQWVTFDENLVSNLNLN